MIGHRGFCQAAPENTLPSFALAVAAGADLVELDVHQSKDGQWLVVHDSNLDRTTDAVKHWGARRIRVASKTAAEIRMLDAGTWFDPMFAGAKVPMLTEVLAALPKDTVALIEQKGGHGPDLIKFLRQHALSHSVIVQSFDWEFLRRFHEHEHHQALAALGPARRLPNGKRPLGIARKLNRAWLNQAHQTGAKVVVWSRKVSRGAIRLAHERGLQVWVYTVNDARLARRLLRAGVDGFITDNPLRLRNSHSFGRGPRNRLIQILSRVTPRIARSRQN